MKKIITCPDYCGTCEKDKKSCEAYKSRGRAIRRDIYKAKKNKEKKGM